MKPEFKKLALIGLIFSVILIITACSKKVKDTVNDSSLSVTGEDNGSAEIESGSSDESLQAPGNNAENENSKTVKDEAESINSKEDTLVQEAQLVDGGIKSIYEKYNMLTGTCINSFVINSLSDHITENYNSITLENDMKPEAILNQSKSIESGDIVVEYPQRTLDQLEWAKKNNIKARGHVLVWYSQTPDWIFYKDFDTTKETVDRDTMLARMESYIRQNFELLEEMGYIDIFYAYDIVNEAILDDGTLRDCLWKQTIGDDYIWYAFYFADKYAPENIKLFYNDYNEQFKADYIIKLAESLVDENGRSLIDGIGCQGHLYTGDSIDQYIKTLEAFSATGLDVQITEIDVSLGTWQNILEPTDENLKEQGRWYYEFFNRILEGSKAGTIRLSAVTFWGLADATSWRRERSPLLFDTNFKPKYAYYGVVQDYEHAGY